MIAACIHPRGRARREDLISWAGYRWRVVRCACGWLHEGEMLLDERGDAVRAWS